MPRPDASVRARSTRRALPTAAHLTALSTLIALGAIGALGGLALGCQGVQSLGQRGGRSARDSSVESERGEGRDEGREGSDHDESSRRDRGRTKRAEARLSASKRPPSGTTCSGRSDCASDQVCVGGMCRYRRTSVAGEVLAAAAQAQSQAGDWEGSLRTYDQSFSAFAEQDAPVPPEIACDAAALILETATEADQRERGARHADLCFRSTYPGHEGRGRVHRALARLRFEGLEVSLFDRTDPAERFFTQEPSRPTLDAVRIAVNMPDLEERDGQLRSHEAVRNAIHAERARNAIAECFIQDWEVRHERSAQATLRLSYATRMRDMGSYDVYEPQLAVQPTTPAEEGFEPCVAANLANVVEVGRSGARSETWEQTIDVQANIQ